MKYEIFVDARLPDRYINGKTAREELAMISYNLARYLHNNQIKNVMFLDRGARLCAFALNKAWHRLYDTVSIPEMYFTNPRAYQDAEETRLLNEFNSTYTKLAANKKEPLMLFDVCLHTGRSMNSVLNFLRDNGYKVVTGLAQPKDIPINHLKSPCYTKIDFFALDKKLEYLCSPFTKDRIIGKKGGRISSKEVSGFIRLPALKISAQTRKEISHVFELKAYSPERLERKLQRQSEPLVFL